MRRNPGPADDLIVGLDIGTTKVCAVIGQLAEPSGEIEIIGVGSTPSRGLRRGVVVNIDKTIKSILTAVEEAEMMSGREVAGVYAGIAGGHIEGLNSRGVVAVSSRDREIAQEDVNRVVDAARAIAIPMDREIIHVIPQEFIVDQQGGITDPIGMVGVRLEAEVHIITGSVTSIQNVVKCANRAGFKVYDIALEPLASSKAVLTNDEKELGVLLIDLGGGTTDVLVHLNGAPYHTSVIALGGDQVTSDISIVLKTPLEAAERIKTESGCCFLPMVEGSEDVVTIPGVGGRLPESVRTTDVARIIQPRMTEIFGLVRAELDKRNLLQLLGGGVVLTGGGALIRGAGELAREVFGLPTRVGYPLRLGGLVEEYQSPVYATGVGLVLYGASVRQRGVSAQPMGERVSGRGVLSRMRSWFREFF
jgi:cell division protein FtsA